MDVATDSRFVTEDDIAASLSLKDKINENDSVSFSGSCVSVGTLSGLSACSAFSLNALKQRRNQLIESIRSQLNSSGFDDSLQTPNTSLLNDDNLFTSTPYREHVPPAAKLLKDWRSFSNIEEIVDKDDSSEKPVGYEEAFESLKSILGENEDMLGTYESALEVYKKNEDQKLEEFMSFFEEDKEISSINDITVINLMTESEDDKLKDNNDNTIINIDSSNSEIQTTLIHKQQDEINDKEKVIKELDLKDPENVIIAGEEDVAADITLVDEERLLASDTEDEPIPVSIPTAGEAKGKQWTEFISNDPDENRDNNDPRWESLRNLGSDYERYEAVKQRWMNIDVPNPKKDLTCRCRQNSINTVALNNDSSLPTTSENPSKRPYSPTDCRNNKKARVEACTMLFDRCINKSLVELELQKRMLDKEQERALNHLADTQRLDQINAYHCRISDQEIRTMKARHCRETYDLMRNFSARRENLITTSRQKIEDLRQAASEVREFHEFYPEGKSSLIYLSDVEVEEILEVESMFTRFENFYGQPST